MQTAVRLPALVMSLYCCGTTTVVTTHTLHAVCVLLVCGPSPYTGYQVDFLCLQEQGTTELISIHNLAFICLVLTSVTHI
jgi:hypothetical protein